jgi:hypothetical protein
MNRKLNINRKGKVTIISLTFVFLLLTVFNFDTVKAYTLYVDNNVDSQNPDVDSGGDKGTASALSGAQTLDGSDQTLTEEDTGGGGGSAEIGSISSGSGKKVVTADISHVVNSDSNRVTFVIISAKPKTGGGGDYATSVTWDVASANEALTEIGNQQNFLPTIAIWYGVGLTAKIGLMTIAGPNNQWSWSGFVVGIINVHGVDQDYPYKDYQEDTQGRGITDVGIDLSTASGDICLSGLSQQLDTSPTDQSDPAADVFYNVSSSGDIIGTGFNTTADDTSTHMNVSVDTSGDIAFAGISVNATGGGTNYELDWEYQISNLDLGKDRYNVTCFGYASGGDSETFSIFIWNSSWYDTGLDLSTTEKWHNISISGSGITSSTTFRILGNTESSDSTQSVANIDYFGVRGWNFTVDVINATFDLTGVGSVSGNYSVGTSYSLPTKLVINVSSGDIYTLQIKGTDVSNTSVNDGFIYWDNDDNPSGSTALTTSYVTWKSSQSVGDKIQHTIYLFIIVPWTPGGAKYVQEDWIFDFDVKIILG